MLQTKATAPEGQILSDHEIPMYDELWTAARAMYKLEPAVATDGEVVIYAPHLDTVSHVHGRYICEVGYRILPYFLKHCARLNWVIWIQRRSTLKNGKTEKGKVSYMCRRRVKF